MWFLLHALLMCLDFLICLSNSAAWFHFLFQVMHLGICQNPIFSVQASRNSHKISVAIGIESISLKRSVVCSLYTCVLLLFLLNYCLMQSQVFLEKWFFKHMYTSLSILKLGKGFCLSMLHLSSLLCSIPIISNSVYFVHHVFSAPATSWRMKLLLNICMSLLMEQGYNVWGQPPWESFKPSREGERSFSRWLKLMAIFDQWSLFNFKSLMLAYLKRSFHIL